MGDNAVILNEIAEDAGGGVAGEEAIIDAILFDLDTTFPEAPNAATANFIEAVVQNWGEHPYTLGVYSYAKIGTFTTASDSFRADLQVPVAGNRIFFAGEGSHVTHPATVVGALHEGERAADEVHGLNGIPDNPPPPPGEACSAGDDDLVFSNVTHSDVQIHEACISVTYGPNYLVGPSGDVTVTAPFIVLGPETTIDGVFSAIAAVP